MEYLELINKFREKVSSDDFVYFKFSNVNGRNQWSCICSAMDWITVAIEYIADVRSGKRSYQQSMEMYAYISSIDVVWEAIQQIHRVLFQTKRIPFFNDRKCFQDKILDQDDNDYFKTIRACFGAHPVNLNFKGKNGDEKYFASWSGTSLGGDYDVLLYSNIVDKEFRTMPLKIEEVNKFLEKIYKYLNRLMDEIDRQYKEFENEMKKKPIQKIGDTCNQLLILKVESAKRLDLVHFRVLIDKLIMIFDTQITNKTNGKMVSEYKEMLIPLINQIYNSLQNMNFDEIDDSILYQTSDRLPNGYGYWMEKISSYIHGSGYRPIIWEDRIKEIFKEHMIMEYSSYQELYVLILSCINRLNKKEE